MRLSQCLNLQAVLNELIFEYGTVSNLKHILCKCEEHGLLSESALIAYEAGIDKETLGSSIAIRTWITLLQLSSKSARNELEVLLTSLLFLSNENRLDQNENPESADSVSGIGPSTDHVIGTKYYHRLLSGLVSSSDKKSLLLVGKPDCLGRSFLSSLKHRYSVGESFQIESYVDVSNIVSGTIDRSSTITDVVSTVKDKVTRGKDVFWHCTNRSYDSAGISSIGLVGEMSRSGMSVIGMTSRLSLAEYVNARPYSLSVTPLLIHPISLSVIYEAAVMHANIVGLRHGVIIPNQFIETIINKVRASIPESDLLDKVLSVIDALIVHQRRNESNHTPLSLINIIIEKTLTTQVRPRELFDLFGSQGWYGIRQDDAKVVSQHLWNSIAGVALFPLRPNLCLGLYGWSEHEQREFIDMLCLANGTATGDVIEIDVVASHAESDRNSCHLQDALGLSCALDIDNFRARSVIVIHGADQCSVDTKAIIADILTAGIILNDNLEPVTFSESIVVVVAENPLFFETVVPGVALQRRNDIVEGIYGCQMTTNSPLLDFEFARNDCQSIPQLINAIARIIGEDCLRGVTFAFTERAGVYFSALSARQASEIFVSQILPAVAPSEEREHKPVIVDIDNGRITIVNQAES